MLTIISVIIICGYQYNILKHAIDRKEDLSGFNNVLTNGVKYLAVVLSYNIIPATIGILSFQLNVLAFISIILFIVSFFMMIMALNNMVAYDKLVKAFDFKEIHDKIHEIGFAKYIGGIIFLILILEFIIAIAVCIFIFITVFLGILIAQPLAAILIYAVLDGFLMSYCIIFLTRSCGLL